MTSGKSIKATRDRVGESQADFARRFGVDQATLSRWETLGIPARGSARLMVEKVLRELNPEGAE